MKLFIHDEKHEQVHHELDLGNLSDSDKSLIQKIIDFLSETEITNRYKRLALAKSYEIIYNDGEPEVIFES